MSTVTAPAIEPVIDEQVDITITSSDGKFRQWTAQRRHWGWEVFNEAGNLVYDVYSRQAASLSDLSSLLCKQVA
jgi:hypothetical protein